MAAGKRGKNQVYFLFAEVKKNSPQRWAADTGKELPLRRLPGQQEEVPAPPPPSPQPSSSVPHGMNVRYCRLCELHLTSEIVAAQHYAGKAHAKKKRRVEMLEDTTAWQRTGPAPVAPAASPAPAPPLADDLSAGSGGFGDAETTTTAAPPSPDLTCEVCRLRFVDLGSLAKHMQSPDHFLKQMRGDKHFLLLCVVI